MGTMPPLIKIILLLLLLGLAQLMIAEIAGQNGGIMNIIKREVKR
jgi:hypothetical protein